MFFMKLLTIALTSRCDRACPYCPVAQWRNDGRDSLTLDSVMDFISKASPTHIELTGGEPTLCSWLNELCDFLESRDIAYLIKSNGLKRCRNQITAWHGDIAEPPANYDKILIIKDTPEWELKEAWCKENSIPFRIIGKDKDCLRKEPLPFPVQLMFLCPDGHLKQCPEHEILLRAEEKNIASEPVWVSICPSCKSVWDFLEFL